MGSLNGAKEKDWRETIESRLDGYWGGIRELIGTYFSQPRPLEKDAAWIRVTLYKEIRSIPRILPQITSLYDQVDVAIDRHHYEDLAYELADEVKHYRLLADILDWATGGKITPGECKPSPEQLRLEELRERKDSLIWNDLWLVPHLNVAHECVFASVMKEIQGEELERRIASAYSEIFADEIRHYQIGWEEIRELRLEEAQVERVIQANRKVARQYLVMRNELFGSPLSEKRLNEIDLGKVEPYRPR